MEHLDSRMRDTWRAHAGRQGDLHGARNLCPYLMEIKCAHETQDGTRAPLDSRVSRSGYDDDVLPGLVMPTERIIGGSMSAPVSHNPLTRDMIRAAADSAVYRRGLGYLHDDMVLLWDEEEPGLIVGEVAGSMGQTYETILDLRGSRLKTGCSCPYDRSKVCKHAVALALDVIEYQELDEKAPADGDEGDRDDDSWIESLNCLLGGDGSQPKKSPGQYRAIYRLGITPDGQLTVEVRKAWIGKKGKGRETAFSYYAYAPNSFLRTKDRTILSLLDGAYPYLHRRSTIVPDDLVDPILRLFADEQYAFVAATDSRPEIGSSPARTSLALIENGDRHELRLRVRGGDSGFAEGTTLHVLGDGKPWVTDGVAYRPLESEFSGSTMREFLKMPRALTERHIPVFMERFYTRASFEIESTKIGEIRDDVPPRPVVCLDEEDGSLAIKLSFAYGDGPPQIRCGDPQELVRAAKGEDCFWTRRLTAAEEEAIAKLTAAGAAVGRDGIARLRGDDALDFLVRSIGSLKSEGWEIVGETTGFRVKRSVPRISAKVESGIDWFDLHLEVEYDGSSAGLWAVLAAYRSGRKYIQLDDGCWVNLPLDWLRSVAAPLEELEDLHGAGENSGVRVKSYDIPLVEQVVAEVDVEADSVFDRLRTGLSSFDGIAPVALPRGLKANLRDYQSKGLEWLGFLEEFSFGGILADDMGLGKTVQTLAHLLKQKEEARSSGPSLIVVPTSVAFNWEQECSRFTPELKVLRLTGPERKRRFDEIPGADLVITTYALLRHDFEELRGHDFFYVVLDEAQNIKNPAAQTSRCCKALKGRHRLALTGTPMENNLTEIWSVFDFLMPGFLGPHKRFQTKYERPIASRGDQQALELLKRRLNPFMLRRVKEDVARELPPKTEIVSYCDMTPAQRALYQQVLNTYRGKVLQSIADKGIERSQITILDALLKLRQVCNHPSLLRLAANKVKTSGKMGLFQEMVEELVSEGHRALVFSQFTGMLSILRKWLDHEGIDYCYLDGRTRNRRKVIEAFNEGGATLFLISLKAGGTGLNLTAADYVVHVDPWWNPQVEAQATDRAYRIGQDKHVFVYKMITKDSIEEKILKLQDRKKELFNSLLSPEAGIGKSLTREDLEELFS